jgi:hypothetical protein
MTTNTVQSKWRPSTRLGWWAVWLMAACVVMYITVMAVMALQLSLPPVFGILMMLCALSSGVVGIVALVKQHERSRLVWLAILPLLWGVFMLLGEFLVPH